MGKLEVDIFFPSQQKYVENAFLQKCSLFQMTRVIRKPDFCICENKVADQLRGDREADQSLRFRYTYSTTRLLPRSEISSLYPHSVIAQPGLCRTWSETPKTGFLTSRLKWSE